MLHLRKAFPSSQHSLEAQHTFVCPAVCAGWLPGRLSPEPAASTGTPRAARGALLAGHGRKSPTAGKGRGCWLQGNVCQSGTNRWRAKCRCSVLPQLRAPRESAKLEGTHKGPALSPAQDTPESHPVPESVSQMLLELCRFRKAKPSASRAFAILGKLFPADPEHSLQ